MAIRRRIHKKHICVVFLGMTTFLIYLISESRNPETLELGQPQWDDPGPYHVAYPRNYKFIMDDTPVCKSRDPFLLLMVVVAPADVAARDVIRKTWAKEKVVLGQMVDILFLMGLPTGAHAEQQQQKLQAENQQNHDMIQSNFEDSTYNLTIKTMVMMEWLAANCQKTTFVMKVDSDIFLNVQNLVKHLLDPSTATQNYVTGLVIENRPVLRNPYIRFYMPREIVAEPVYPPYPLGTAYVMSLDVAVNILTVSREVKPINIVDVYLGMCLKHLNVSPINSPEAYTFVKDPIHPLSNCSLSKAVAVATVDTTMMMNYWKKSKDPETKC